MKFNHLGDFCTRGFWSTRQEDLGYRQGMAQAAQARIPAQNLAQIPEMGEKSTPADPPKLCRIRLLALPGCSLANSHTFLPICVSIAPLHYINFIEEMRE